MGINREQVHVGGNREFVVHRKVRRARRNVERRIILKLEEHRKLRGRFIGKVQAKTRLDRFGPSGRLEVGVEHEVVTRIQSERHTRRFRVRHGTWFPEKEVAVRIEGLRFNPQLHAGKAVSGIFLPGSR